MPGPVGAIAIGLVAADAVLALAGLTAPIVSVLALILAPGLALARLLPARMGGGMGVIAAVPALGFAASSVLVISVARVGIPLTGLSVRLCIAVLVVGALGLIGEPRLRGRVEPLEVVGLVVALVAFAVLGSRVIGDLPVPGNDWAKYLLYADEIRRQGSLLIDNPYWMLGVPFREDPGVPALYGSFLILTGEPAATLARGIGVFAGMGLLSAFAFVRAWSGWVAGVLTAVLLAVTPISQDILGWHGLANVAALALLPLAFLYVTVLASDGLSTREAGGFAIVVVALGATHRLTTIVGAIVLGLVLAVALIGGDRRRIARDVAVTAGIGLAIGAAVLLDVVARQRTFGGTQSYQAYLSTKIELEFVVRDLSIPFALAAVCALVLAGFPRVRSRGLVPVLALLAVAAALAYGWLAHVPLAYARMVYYLPLALASLVAVVIARLLKPPAALVVGAVLAIAMGIIAWGQADNVRRFYSFANPTSLRGLNSVASAVRPGDVVVTDRCWSFLATWLIHTRTLAALDPADIQPRAEAPFAAEARQILAGTPRGDALARRLGVRYVLADPTCRDSAGRPLSPPSVGAPVFVSERLVVIEIIRRR